MTITARSCAEFLREHNDWRRGGEGNMQTPYEIGRHIDFAIGALEQAVDIDTLEQESRQMRARMERLEAELETERALSFRNQVAELEKQRDELLADAERYRFIRGHETWDAQRSSLPKWYGGRVRWIGGTYSCDEIDKIIDAAIDNAKEPK